MILFGHIQIESIQIVDEYQKLEPSKVFVFYHEYFLEISQIVPYFPDFIKIKQIVYPFLIIYFEY